MNFWNKVKSNTFHVKLQYLLFGQLLEKFGLFFNLASDHSDRESTKDGLFERNKLSAGNNLV